VRERWLLCPTPNWNLKTTLPPPTILVKSIWEFALARHKFGIWEFALARALARSNWEFALALALGRVIWEFGRTLAPTQAQKKHLKKNTGKKVHLLPEPVV
jgi:hypothetical protein